MGRGQKEKPFGQHCKNIKHFEFKIEGLSCIHNKILPVFHLFLILSGSSSFRYPV